MRPNARRPVLMLPASYGPAASTRVIIFAISSVRDVSCAIEGKDRYGNDLGVCFVGGIDLGRDLVKHDWRSSDQRLDILPKS